jgi:dihydroorotase
MNQPLLLRGVRPYGEGRPVDLLLRDGVIAELASTVDGTGARVIDAGGLVALPGFVDLHTHLREPGREDAETIETGSAAAALGGFTAVHAMANTDPVADVRPVGAVTAGLRGERLAEIGAMAGSAAHVRIFSDDGNCVADPLLMRHALEYSTVLDAVIAQHAEDPRLTAGAQAHEDEMATQLGLAGWPAAAEESIIARDCMLAEAAAARLHVCHVSTSGGSELLRWFKDRGVRVSAEVTPHHLLLDHSRLRGFDPVYKVNPPLRSEHDVQALRQALADGVIDCVATDHAPHAPQDKDCEWAAARPGMLGLQTALSVVVQTMVHSGLLDWRGVAAVMSERPAAIAGLHDHGREVAVGAPATITLVDPDSSWTVRGPELASLSSNTPYEGMKLPAAVVTTVLRGRITAHEGEVA